MKPRVLAVVATAALFVLPAAPAGAAPAGNPPAVPESLTAGGLACAADGILIGTTAPRITARFADPDLGVVQGETMTPAFALWPADDPARRTEWTEAVLSHPGTVSTAAPAALANGGRYGLSARATDAAGNVAAWSPVCIFTVDTTVPHAPAVSSTDYPEDATAGGPGVDGDVTFAATGGDEDVASFEFSWAGSGPREVPADSGGRATVAITPTRAGGDVLTVRAVDRTGNRSRETSYGFTVLDPTPRVLDENPEAGFGEPRTVHFRSAVPDTASFTYRFNGGPAATVPAHADGAAAVVVRPDRRGDNLLTVTSRTAAGAVSPEATAHLVVPVRVVDPVITSPDFPGDGTPPPMVGQEVTIELRTNSPEVTAFVWSAGFGAGEQVAAADANGNAVVRYTPREYPYLEIQARARTADGFESNTVYAGWELTPAE